MVFYYKIFGERKKEGTEMRARREKGRAVSPWCLVENSLTQREVWLSLVVPQGDR